MLKWTKLFANFIHSHAHRVGMSFQLFVFSHNNNSVTDTSDTFISQTLERNLAVITIQIDAIICQRITMSRKGMIGTTGIITSTL